MQQGVINDSGSDNAPRHGVHPLAGARVGMVHTVNCCYELVEWDAAGAMTSVWGNVVVDPVTVFMVLRVRARRPLIPT